MYIAAIRLVNSLPRWIIGPMLLVWALCLMGNPQGLYICTSLFTLIIMCINLIKLKTSHFTEEANLYRRIFGSSTIIWAAFIFQVLGLAQVYFIPVDYPLWVLFFVFFVLPLLMMMAHFDFLSRHSFQQ
jgi:uncharacterized membrane protein